jgi:hypothetical protein
MPFVAGVVRGTPALSLDMYTRGTPLWLALYTIVHTSGVVLLVNC